MEHRLILDTEDDVEIFKSYKETFESQKNTHLEEFSSETNELVESAAIVTGRSMSATNFDILIKIIQIDDVNYGVIEYKFEWEGFAKLEGDKILIGDVFEGGFYLYQDDILIVTYPSGYIINFVSPTPDSSIVSERKLVWNGQSNFDSGEPSITFSPTEKGESKGESSCFIATATYGSELSPEVQFLRSFRDYTVTSTFAGYQFMTVFHRFYYSFSPYIAHSIADNPAIKAIIKIILYPLIEILQISTIVNPIFHFNSEFAIIMTGLIASSLIGTIYFSPWIVTSSLIFKRFRNGESTHALKPIAILLLLSTIGMVIGEIFLLSSVMMVSTAVFVLTIISLSSLIVTMVLLLIIKALKYIAQNRAIQK
jgi:hypothetical protein